MWEDGGEIVVFNLRIEKSRQPLHETGGEYATLTLEIYVDPSLTNRSANECVVHSIVENYCPSWPHEKYDELGGLILDGLEQLRVLRLRRK